MRHQAVSRRCACGGLVGPGGECAACRARRLARAAQPRRAPALVSDVLRSPGAALDASTRADMGRRFGHDFSGVRVHTDARAASSARALHALAYTVGRDVVFGAGQYAPGTAGGRRVLAHELTHVLQQRGADARGTALRVGGADTRAEREADRTATVVTAGRPVDRPVSVEPVQPQVQRLGDTTRIPPGLACPLPPTGVGPVAESIQFANASSSLTGLDRARLASFAAGWWGAGANQPVRIDGFASTPADDALNWRLSCERAQAVAAELESPSTGGQRGIPHGFLTVFMQGETVEFGAEADNRRVTLSLGPGPSPPPPPPPPPSPTSVDACRRARQAECVMRLGGCANTRPAGIPTPEEIERYNGDCRSETGYSGPTVTPTDDECASGQASPSPADCGRAREEDNICGPDISAPLAAVLADLRSTYAGWSPTQRREACDAITGVPIPFVTSGFIMAWDIDDLFLPHTGWLCSRPYHPPCGTPPSTGCDNEDPAGCGNSVEVSGKCFLAGTVNYALFGQICRVCNDEFGVLSETTMRRLIVGWKALGLLLDDPGPPTAWASAGFHGYPGTIPTTENRGHCRGRCSVPYSRGPFDWIWEPHKPR